MIRAQARIKRLVTWLTAILAVVMAVAPTLLYSLYVNINMSKRLDDLLRVQAVVLEQEINKQPDFWEINSDHIQASFESHAMPNQTYRVTGSKGDIVFEETPKLAWPIMYRSQKLFAFGQDVGNLEAGLSIMRETVIGLILLGISLSGAWLIWFPLRRIPLAALQAAESELISRERYQRALLDNFPYIAWLSDGEDRLLAVNSKFETLLEQQNAGPPRGRTLDELLPPSLLQPIEECQRQMLIDGCTTLEEEKIRIDGHTRWFEIGIAPVDLDMNDQTGMVGYMREITERKEIEAELAEYREHLENQVQLRTEALEKALIAAEAASKAKSEFLSSMSHELRTPLNAILGFAQLLQMEEHLSASSREQVDEIQQAGDHLLSLVNDILDLARIESGRLDIEVVAIPLQPVLADSLTLVAPMAAKKAIVVEDQSDLDPGIMIYADPVRMKQVLLNLLTNAIKYNRPEGSVHITSQRQDNVIKLLVTDTGQGIAKDKQHRIFNAFDRLGRECHTVEGTGIGLVITRRLVETMGGSIDFHSLEGQGSTFWVAFPVAAADATKH